MKRLVYGLVVMISPLFAAADIVPYVEDVYAQQPSEELVVAVQQAADVAGFTKNCELTVPTKAGLQINPWNTFMGYGKNSKTSNPLLVINPEWFEKIPYEQQQFLIVRGLLTLDPDSLSFHAKLWRWISMLFPFISLLWTILAVIFLRRLFARRNLFVQKKWLRFLVAFGCVALLNIVVVNKLVERCLFGINQQYSKSIIALAVEKTQNRDAAISALEYFDASVKRELEQGEIFFAPYEHLFAGYAAALK